MTMVGLSRDNECHWSREHRDDDVARAPDNKKKWRPERMGSYDLRRDVKEPRGQPGNTSDSSVRETEQTAAGSDVVR